MARKKKSSPAEDFIAVIALVPWWVGLLIGTIAYVVLHGIATSSTPVVGAANDVGGALYGMFARALAQAGQYLVPLLCLVGAGVSLLGRKKRADLLDGVLKSGEVEALNAMTWQEFEQMVGEWFRRQGYAIVEVGGAGPDGGIDLILHRNGDKFLVQCKQWRALKVGVSVVRELYGVMAAEKAAGGFVVSSGSFSDDAKKFAHGRNVELLDGPMLTRMLRTSPPLQHGQHVAAPDVKNGQDGRRPCPTCGAQMLHRVAKRGTNAGQAFLGCSAYPECKTTLPIPTAQRSTLF